MTGGRSVWILATMLVACTKREPTPADPPVAEQKAEAKVAEQAKSDERTLTLVGIVHEGGTQTCNATGEQMWSAKFWAIGFTPVVHDAVLGKALENLEGRIVKVTGRPTPDDATIHGSPNPPRSATECPVMQMRSDWELWPGGIRIRRGDEPSIGTIAVQSVSPVTPLRARAEGEEVVFGVTNPFDVPLRNATLVAHYEGCYGKPGSTTVRRPLGTIEPGADVEDIPVPRLDIQDGPRGRDHRLSAVRVLGEVDGGAIDLDVLVSTLGVSVECPKR